MHPRVVEVLAEYEERLARENPVVAEFTAAEYVEHRDECLLGIGAETGRFLNILIKAARPRTIVEAGTCYGYSTIWLAEAAASVGGRVVSLEVSGAKIAFARERLSAAGLSSQVEFVEGDALRSLDAFDGTIDFALIDLWKELYVPTFDRIFSRLAEGALVAADNVCLPPLHAEAMKTYISHVRGCEGIESVTVPVGSGIELSRFSRGA
jgi:predicted O-methyltransferase YrrM